MWKPSREYGFHALRQFYASEKLEAGESVVSLARWLGHSDPVSRCGSTPTSCPARRPVAPDGRGLVCGRLQDLSRSDQYGLGYVSGCRQFQVFGPMMPSSAILHAPCMSSTLSLVMEPKMPSCAT